jgi:altronate hydrolase
MDRSCRKAMKNRILKVHPEDNVVVALTGLKKDDRVGLAGMSYLLSSDVPAKHKFAARDLAPGDAVIMYGILVGRAVKTIRQGELLSTRNTRHEAAAFHDRAAGYRWDAPEISGWRQRTFLVFCETRNVNVIKQAFEEELGYAPPQIHRRQVADLVNLYRAGKEEEIRAYAFESDDLRTGRGKVFANLDGIKFLVHTGGCGGTREDSNNLCGLLAGYIHHPNVAGATVLSLGCQNAQVRILREEIRKRDPWFAKPVLVFEQQQSGSEFAMLSEAIRQTFVGLVEADKSARSPAPLSRLSVALKCGGSDGFSGISANPATGHVADLVTALGGTSVLAEFPELCGVEQALIDRCVHQEDADRFIQLMRAYAARAEAVGSGFDMNPSPGNIRDGLITDAMKSAGAAKKGGSSPVAAVLDYPEYATRPGLNLLCTPGNDVEAVTAEVGAGANVVLFTTGLGTPTGNPIVPVVKIATNSELEQRMRDIIDIDAGTIVSGEKTVEQMGEAILDLVVRVASGEVKTKAELLGQDDFIPWKRGISL